jgi:hypothetical protein
MYENFSPDFLANLRPGMKDLRQNLFGRLEFKLRVVEGFGNPRYLFCCLRPSSSLVPLLGSRDIIFFDDIM